MGALTMAVTRNLVDSRDQLARPPDYLERIVSLEEQLDGFANAMSVYLDRFLNIPLAPLPGEQRFGSLDDESTDAEELRQAYLDSLDTQQQVDRAGRIVARYASLHHPVEPLFATFARGDLPPRNRSSVNVII